MRTFYTPSCATKAYLISTARKRSYFFVRLDYICVHGGMIPRSLQQPVQAPGWLLLNGSESSMYLPGENYTTTLFSFTSRNIASWEDRSHIGVSFSAATATESTVRVLSFLIATNYLCFLISFCEKISVI